MGRIVSILMICLCALTVVSVKTQNVDDELVASLEDLLPGSHRLNVDGVLDSEGSLDPELDIYPISFYAGVDAEVNILDIYTDAIWQEQPVVLLVRLQFIDVPEEAISADSDQISLWAGVADEEIVFDRNPEGRILIEALYPDFTGAFDFTLANEAGEQIRVQGAASGIRNTGVPTFPEVDSPGELAAELRNAIYSSGDDMETEFYFGEDSEGDPALYLDFLMEGVYSTDPDTLLRVLVRLLVPPEMGEHISLHPTSLGLPPLSELERREVGFIVQVADDEPFVALETDANEFFTGKVNDDGTISGSIRFYAHREDAYLVFEAAFVQIPVEES